MTSVWTDCRRDRRSCCCGTARWDGGL